MHHGICLVRSERDQKATVCCCSLNSGKCLLALGSCSSVCKAKKLNLGLCKTTFALKMFADHVSSAADRHKITYLVLSQCKVKAEFERNLINGDSDVLYKGEHDRNSVQAAAIFKRGRGAVVFTRALAGTGRGCTLSDGV